MTYQLGKTYRVSPHGEPKQAEFVGWIRLDNREEWPVFKGSFLAFGGPSLVILKQGKWLAAGHTVQEMLDKLQSVTAYHGTQHEQIRLDYSQQAPKLERAEFVRQARATTMKPAEIDQALMQGYRNHTLGKHGEVKWCPACKALRDTTCSGCGCGSCKSCGHRWSCRGPIDPLVASFLAADSPGYVFPFAPVLPALPDLSQDVPS